MHLYLQNAVSGSSAFYPPILMRYPPLAQLAHQVDLNPLSGCVIDQ
jgi:hypothetical protein